MRERRMTNKVYVEGDSLEIHGATYTIAKSVSTKKINGKTYSYLRGLINPRSITFDGSLIGRRIQLVPRFIDNMDGEENGKENRQDIIRWSAEADGKEVHSRSEGRTDTRKETGSRGSSVSPAGVINTRRTIIPTANGGRGTDTGDIQSKSKQRTGNYSFTIIKRG